MDTRMTHSEQVALNFVLECGSRCAIMSFTIIYSHSYYVHNYDNIQMYISRLSTCTLFMMTWGISWHGVSRDMGYLVTWGIS